MGGNINRDYPGKFLRKKSLLFPPIIFSITSLVKPSVRSSATINGVPVTPTILNDPFMLFCFLKLDINKYLKPVQIISS
jgi:hypothetical protein